MAFRDVPDRSRFELDHDGGTSYASYRERGGVRVISHVETPAALRGKGGAGKLMDEIVAAARAGGYKLDPHCAYAVAYFRRRRDAADVLA